MMNLIIDRFKHIGEIPLCNGISSRAPHIFGFSFPLCYRCSAFIIAFLCTLYYGRHHQRRYNLWVYVLCLLPMIIDGCLQTFWYVESTNLRRVLTGSLFGYGIGMLVTYLFQLIDRKYESE